MATNGGLTSYPGASASRAGSDFGGPKAGVMIPASSANKRKWTNRMLWDNALRSTKLVVIGEPGERAWFNVMLVFFPLAFISQASGWPPGATFALSLIAMMPLAERLGFCTECIADHTNDTLGGLMNATMGNAPELIISMFALRDGLLRVVQVSLLGSILSNLLLVLGTGFLLGGMKHRDQTFNAAASHLNAGLLLLAVMCLLFPAVLVASNTEVATGDSVLLLSRLVSIVMLLVYCGFLVFQLKTHAHLFEQGEDEEEEAAASGGETDGGSVAGSDDSCVNEEEVSLRMPGGAAPAASPSRDVTGGEPNVSSPRLSGAGGVGLPHTRSARHIPGVVSKRSLPAALHASRGASPDPAQLSAMLSLRGLPTSALPLQVMPSLRNINVGAHYVGEQRAAVAAASAPSSAAAYSAHLGGAGSDSEAPASTTPHGSRAGGRRLPPMPPFTVAVEEEGDEEGQEGEPMRELRRAGHPPHAAVAAAGSITSALSSGTDNSGAGLMHAGRGSRAPIDAATGGGVDAPIPARPFPVLSRSSGGPGSPGGSSRDLHARGEAGAAPLSPAPGVARNASLRNVDIGPPRSLSPGANRTSLPASASASPSAGAAGSYTPREVELVATLALPPRQSLQQHQHPLTEEEEEGAQHDTIGSTVGLTRAGKSAVATAAAAGRLSLHPHRGAASGKRANLPHPPSPPGAGSVSARGAGGGGAPPEAEPPMGLWTAIAWLCIVTAGVASLSEVLVSSISGAAASAHLSEMFVSAILLPIAGNAAEHASAVIFAYKNRLDISLGVAIGSSTQIALFVAPFCVIIGWIIGQPLSLNFQMFETATVFATVLMVNFIIIDGRSNWMIGLLLVAGYAIVAISFSMHSGSGTVR